MHSNWHLDPHWRGQLCISHNAMPISAHIKYLVLVSGFRCCIQTLIWFCSVSVVAYGPSSHSLHHNFFNMCFSSCRRRLWLFWKMKYSYIANLKKYPNSTNKWTAIYKLFCNILIEFFDNIREGNKRRFFRMNFSQKSKVTKACNGL